MDGITPIQKIPNAFLKRNDIDEIVGGIKQSPNTTLLDRDIPDASLNYQVDPHTIPTYVPPPNMTNYIPYGGPQGQPMYQQTNGVSSADNMYEQIKLPLLIGILFFMFQLPIVKQTLMNSLPSICLPDGNMNLYGIMLMSALFAGSIHGLVKILF